jgi:hypothetical protein
MYEDTVWTAARHGIDIWRCSRFYIAKTAHGTLKIDEAACSFESKGDDANNGLSRITSRQETTLNCCP